MSTYLMFEPPVTEYDLTDQLMHHGVKGMKWGVRKDRRSPFEKRYKNKDAIDLFDQMNQISYVSRPTVLERMNLKQRYLEAKKDSFRRTLRNTPIDSKFEKAIKRYERAHDKSWDEHERKPYDPDRHEKAIEEMGRAYKQVTKEMLRSIGAKNLKDEDVQRVINHRWADEILDTYWGANPKYPLPLYSGMNVKDPKKVTHSDATVDELYHHGVKGMKWGIRRYQPYGPGQVGKFIGDSAKKVKSTAGKIVQNTKSAGASIKTAASNASARHAEKKAIRQAVREAKAKAAHEAAKNKALESGDINQVAKYKSELTHEEITKALLKISDNQRIDEAVQKSKESGAWDAADKLMKRVNQVSGYVGTAANLYQNMTNLKKNRKSLQDFNKSLDDEADAKERKEKVDKMIKKQQWDKLDKFARSEGLDQNEYQRILNAAENQKKLKGYTQSEKDKKKDTERTINTATFEELQKKKGSMSTQDYTSALSRIGKEFDTKKKIEGKSKGDNSIDEDELIDKLLEKLKNKD